MRALQFVCQQPWAIQAESLQLILEIAARENDFDPEAVLARSGRKLDYTRTVTNRDGVAILPVEGPIVRYASLFSEISGATSVAVLAQDFRAALEDPAIHSIILAIDSPGGQVNGIAEFADMVYAARERKPVKAYVGDLGASAAYWIASAAGEVIAAATASLGNIGIALAVKDPAAQSAREIQFVSSQSPHKRPDPTTEIGKGHIQATVDALADVFVADVARNRNVTPDKVLSDFGMGWIKVGQAAVDAGLADRLGSLEGLIEELATAHNASGRTSYAAHETPIRPGAAIERSKPMGFKERMAALFAAEIAKDEEGEPGAEISTALAPSVIAPQPDPRISQLEAEVARLNAARITAEATGFADTEIAAGRAFPAEREALIAAFAQAATDDGSHGGATSRTEQIRAVYAARPPHGLTQEVIPAAGNEALLNRAQTQRGANEPAPQAERDELLAMTSLGRAALADRKNGHN